MPGAVREVFTLGLPWTRTGAVHPLPAETLFARVVLTLCRVRGRHTRNRPLGKPKADAVKGADGVWRREFASGTKVTFDSSTGKGKIMWAQ